MKVLLVFLSVVLLQQTALAKKGDLPEEADYMVPTSPEMVPYSRFKLKIETPYLGDATKSISYVFPAELTGVANYKITLNRVGDTNTWESPEVTAVCTESGELFSCNIYVKKAAPAVIEQQFITKFNAFQLAQARGCGAQMMALNAQPDTEFDGTFINATNVTNFLSGKGLSDQDFQLQLGVAKAFACSEPIGGVLSYEFK